MPVGTAGSVKGVHQRELLNDIKCSHHSRKYLPSIPEARSGCHEGALVVLHKFMNWDRSILTDSGGYQVFSLAANRN